MSITYQQRHEEPVQIDHLDAAYVQLHSAVTGGRVGVSDPFRSIGSQTHGKAEHLVTHDGDCLQNERELSPTAQTS